MAGDPVPQFGRPVAGRNNVDRPCAFGVVERDGRLALVRITREGEAPYHDLPGGALEQGEDDAAALMREFGEETGLRVAPIRLLGRADQYMTKLHDEPVNNRSALFEARVEAETPELKIEADHELVWLEPLEAIARLRHDSHAWAVTLWLRAQAG